MPSSWPKSGGMPCRREPGFMPEGFVVSAPLSAEVRPPNLPTALTHGEKVQILGTPGSKPEWFTPLALFGVWGARGRRARLAWDGVSSPRGSPSHEHMQGNAVSVVLPTCSVPYDSQLSGSGRSVEAVGARTRTTRS